MVTATSVRPGKVGGVVCVIATVAPRSSRRWCHEDLRICQRSLRRHRHTVHPLWIGRRIFYKSICRDYMNQPQLANARCLHLKFADNNSQIVNHALKVLRSLLHFTIRCQNKGFAMLGIAVPFLMCRDHFFQTT